MPPPGACRSRRALAGAKFVFSAVNEAQVLCDLMNQRKGHAFGGRADRLAGDVRSIWTRPASAAHLQQVTIGGSAAPRAMIERIMGMGVTSITCGA